jgi:cobalt/nickel transport system permease protein
MRGVIMHIPENFLSPSTCAVLGITMIPVWRNAAKKVKKELSKKKLPMLGICSAFSFLIMMFNLPLPGGTTGHAVGAVLAAILLGPHAAAISITIAVVIQAIFFGDGGILAIGANAFNLAFVMPYVGYYVYSFIKNRMKSPKGEYFAAFIAGYMGVVIAALTTAIQFGIQPLLFKDAAGLPLYCPYPLQVAIPAMVIPHMLVVGIIEGTVTAGIYGYIRKVSPEALYKSERVSLKPIYMLLIGLVALSPIGLLASGTAWGEWANEEIQVLVGYIPKGMEKGVSFASVVPGYSIAHTPEVLAYILSAVIGVSIIFLLFRWANKMSRS